MTTADPCRPAAPAPSHKQPQLQQNPCVLCLLLLSLAPTLASHRLRNLLSHSHGLPHPHPCCWCSSCWACTATCGPRRHSSSGCP
jgi:hypothetical protein